MKERYEIVKVELCAPPNFIQVSNYAGLNRIEMYTHYYKSNVSKNCVGCWNIKYKNA